ncbi:DNA cytosine methyltransferase [Burkholderia gladioli]|uniref:DNA cytosine methyltransferase n=1 Tax=Burkholderia gladioli TaxID=28095 RepID=UPI00163E2ECA|nr:DNA cytosine methyltransferase [Burkholderia gladioli]
MKRDFLSLPLDLGAELIVDNFAGGGGASTGLERAFGRPVDIAINHDPEALAMHAANHPHTAHYCESVFDVDPVAITRNQPVGLVWLSPDCKHHSKAKGGKPVDKNIRGLAWIALRWAAKVKPRVIMLENVEEFQHWGPLTEDGRPDPKQKGRTFRSFVNALRRQGYNVDHRELRACDHGTPTIRKRIFLIARRDGRAIVWPAQTHFEPSSEQVRAGAAQAWNTAAGIIDWSIPCPSIFGRERPLADATLRRIARGIQKFVIDAADPFIVPAQYAAGATLITAGYGERPGQAPRVPGLDKPLGTVVAGGQHHALVTAFLAKHYGGNGTPGGSLGKPLSTVTTVDHHALVTSHLMKLRGTCRDGAPVDTPLHTISAGGTHHAEVRAFLVKYYGTADGVGLSEPMHTIPTHDRFGLVTVRGEDYAIVDIGMRMLTPRELARGQGFPDSYVIDPVHNGKRLSKASQVRMIGNSVCPDLAYVLARANFEHEQLLVAA